MADACDRLSLLHRGRAHHRAGSGEYHAAYLSFVHALYTNAPQTHPYVGFPDKESKERFIRDSWRAYELLCNAARDEYEILYAIDYEAL